MDMLQAAFGLLMNALVLALVGAGVMKLFQIHTALGEIKEQLGRGPSYAPPMAHVPSYPVYAPPPSAPTIPAPAVGDGRSGEQMLRELDAQMMLEEARRRGGLNPR
jgi:hypothetical protein